METKENRLKWVAFNFSKRKETVVLTVHVKAPDGQIYWFIPTYKQLCHFIFALTLLHGRGFVLGKIFQVLDPFFTNHYQKMIDRANLEPPPS